jgi:hypothetical protein
VHGIMHQGRSSVVILCIHLGPASISIDNTVGLSLFSAAYINGVIFHNGFYLVRDIGTESQNERKRIRGI